MARLPFAFIIDMGQREIPDLEAQAAALASENVFTIGVAPPGTRLEPGARVLTWAELLNPLPGGPVVAADWVGPLAPLPRPDRPRAREVLAALTGWDLRDAPPAHVADAVAALGWSPRTMRGLAAHGREAWERLVALGLLPDAALGEWDVETPCGHAWRDVLADRVRDDLPCPACQTTRAPARMFWDGPGSGGEASPNPLRVADAAAFAAGWPSVLAAEELARALAASVEFGPTTKRVAWVVTRRNVFDELWWTDRSTRQTFRWTWTDLTAWLCNLQCALARHDGGLVDKLCWEIEQHRPAHLPGPRLAALRDVLALGFAVARMSADLIVLLAPPL